MFTSLTASLSNVLNQLWVLSVQSPRSNVESERLNKIKRNMVPPLQSLLNFSKNCFNHLKIHPYKYKTYNINFKFISHKKVIYPHSKNHLLRNITILTSLKKKKKKFRPKHFLIEDLIWIKSLTGHWEIVPGVSSTLCVSTS